MQQSFGIFKDKTGFFAQFPLKAALTATKLAVAAFIVPYVFVLNSAMLFVDTTAAEVITICRYLRGGGGFGGLLPEPHGLMAVCVVLQMSQKKKLAR